MSAHSGKAIAGVPRLTETTGGEERASVAAVWSLSSPDPSAVSAIGGYIKILVLSDGEVEHYRDRVEEAEPKLELVTDQVPKNVAEHTAVNAD